MKDCRCRVRMLVLGTGTLAFVGDEDACSWQLWIVESVGFSEVLIRTVVLKVGGGQRCCSNLSPTFSRCLLVAVQLTISGA
jgi:hypothetical protein